MTDLLGDRWDRQWQMHEDQNGILAGVKDLTFTLRRTATPGPNPEYEFIHIPEDPDNDPFKDTKFYQFGKILRSPPVRKLEPWKKLEEPKYRKLISDTFDRIPANMMRLEGEKIVSNESEALTLYLLPEAISKFGGSAPFVDLIFLQCKTHLEINFGFLRSLLRPRFHQDGTAHGNPK